jgi:hypothetical protein
MLWSFFIHFVPVLIIRFLCVVVGLLFVFVLHSVFIIFLLFSVVVLGIWVGFLIGFFLIINFSRIVTTHIRCTRPHNPIELILVHQSAPPQFAMRRLYVRPNGF